MWAKIEYRSEWRVNKGGCECYRTESRQAAIDKLLELRAKFPRKEYAIQSRDVRLERGAAIRDHLGRPQWGPWIDRNGIEKNS